ncbi:MAG TPA: hypothetical protein VK982_00955 [Bacteroidales bacterium]|nr:hypothetical protein [Bacteroidales bacterium]
MSYHKSSSDFREYCIRVFSFLNPSATFLSIKKYSNNFGEVSNFAVSFNVNYFNAVKKSIAVVENCRLSKRICNGHSFGVRDLIQAREELLWSWNETLKGTQPHPLYTCNQVYEDVISSNGKPLPGVKLHSNRKELHINALLLRKQIIKPVQYPRVDSDRVTLAKRFLRNQTRLKDWRQFKLVMGRFEKLTVNKMEIYG